MNGLYQETTVEQLGKAQREQKHAAIFAATKRTQRQLAHLHRELDDLIQQLTGAPSPLQKNDADEKAGLSLSAPCFADVINTAPIHINDATESVAMACKKVRELRDLLL